MDFPVFEHARWLARAWRHGAPAHNLGASGFLPDDPLQGLPQAVEPDDVGHLDLHAETAFRDAVAAHLGVPTDHVRITAGTSAANTAVVAGSVRPGDHVVSERPTYMPLPQLAQGIGADVTWVDTATGIDVDAFAEACRDSTRLILMTSPNNPTGQVASRDTLRGLADAAADHGALLVVDQVYRELTDHPLGAGSHDAIVSTGGLNKCWGAPGLRIGWAAGTPEAMQTVEDTHRMLNLGPSSFGARMGQALLARRDERRAMLARRLEQTHAVYEAWCGEMGLASDHGDLVAFPSVGDSSMELAQGLVEDGILTVPGGLFGAPGHLRIGLGITPEALRDGLDALGAHLERRAAQRL